MPWGCRAGGMVCFRKGFPPCSENSRVRKDRGHWKEWNLGIKVPTERREQGSFSRYAILFAVERPVGGWHYVTFSFHHISKYISNFQVQAEAWVRPAACWETTHPAYTSVWWRVTGTQRQQEMFTSSWGQGQVASHMKAFKKGEKESLKSLGFLPGLGWFSQLHHRASCNEQNSKKHKD